MTVELTTRRLAEPDVPGGFRSGVAPLDDFLHRYAKQNQRRRLSATWLAMADSEIAGYVTVVGGSAEPRALEPVVPRLPKYDVPVLHLARMATALCFAGHGVGSRLMQVVFREAVDQARRVGCAGIYTDAKPAPEGARSAADFYLKFEFVVVRPPSDVDPTTGMFLPLAKAEKLLG